ncbi:MAG: Re/Si-specific NAD(P)(+) transhydrogenase subunit alpha [Kiritimatiellae bacterium]|nr:Re/Si-specific NAD(P)(+) transhydrogenase subunit alpha [Kiritimatiellia bacterium]MDW8458511.1 Re/Si-specific NAD(P)(+) transhydrogenase subunit alpha [Verrucomicrobiota bacterium]
MKIVVLRERAQGERRVPLIPPSAEKLVRLGASVSVECGIGESIGIPDEAYERAGATVESDRMTALKSADLVLRLRKPPLEDIRLLRAGCLHVSLLDPFQTPELIRALADAGVTAFSLELIPRTTIAQKMDVLSSQANLAGYVAVLMAANRLDKIFPMMSTPAGTIAPARVFVVGAGVAGLQAIATAKRLGAVVEAFDTRPVVEEQVKSLGAKFLKIDLGETGQTKDGYAKALTEEQLRKQREAMARSCANADVVITTAQVFGKRAPLIITDEMIRGMKPGSVIVDLAVETGGNVEGSRLDEEVIIHGVRVLGYGNMPGRVPAHASQMFSSNLANFIEHFWNRETKSFVLNSEDDIIKGCLVTHNGAVVHPAIQPIVEKKA